jgi:hypothetical protein
VEAEVEIVPFEDRYAGDFARLNREWLEDHGLIEPIDERHLRDPRGTIVAGGGELFLALRDGVVVGHLRDSPRRRRRLRARQADGGGERARSRHRPRLTQQALGLARAAGARTVRLYSSSRLPAAVRLYESMGFRHLPMPSDADYTTADVYMELDL